MVTLSHQVLIQNMLLYKRIRRLMNKFDRFFYGRNILLYFVIQRLDEFVIFVGFGGGGGPPPPGQFDFKVFSWLAFC
jgi:hypothetical protein